MVHPSRASGFLVTALAVVAGLAIASCDQGLQTPTSQDEAPATRLSTSSWTCSATGGNDNPLGGEALVQPNAENPADLHITVTDYAACLGSTRCGGPFCDGAHYSEISGSSGADGWSRSSDVAYEWIPEYDARYCPNERVRVASVERTSGSGDPQSVTVLEGTDANGGSTITIDVPDPSGASPWTFDYTVTVDDEGKSYDVDFTCNS